jgi:tetratricopeptide (TPR) repeat protein
MLKKILQLYKNKLFSIIILFLLIHKNIFAVSTEIDTILFEVKIENNRSIISIENQHDWQFQQLTHSPAAKILLKAFRTEKDHNRKLKIEERLPAQSGVKLIRIFPLKPGHYLIALELIEKMEFEWTEDDKSGIVLKDEFLFSEAEMAYHRGLAFHKQGNLKEALNLYRKAVFNDKTHANAYYKAAQIRLDWKQNDLAEINFRHAERLGCDSVMLYLHMANFFGSQGRKNLSNKYRLIYDEKRREDLSDLDSLPELAEIIEEKSPLTNIDSLDTANYNNQIQSTMVDEVNTKIGIPVKLILYTLGSIILLIFLGRKLFKQLATKKFDTKSIINNSSDVNDRSKIHRIGEKPKKHINTSSSKVELEKEEDKIIPEKTVPYIAQTNPYKYNVKGSKEELNLLDNLDINGSAENKIITNDNLKLITDENDYSSKFLEKEKSSSFIENREAEILRLFENNVDVAEIARKMGIGQGEVDLYIRLNKEEHKIKV